jgi:hypothetical protein
MKKIIPRHRLMPLLFPLHSRQPLFGLRVCVLERHLVLLQNQEPEAISIIQKTRTDLLTSI